MKKYHFYSHVRILTDSVGRVNDRYVYIGFQPDVINKELHIEDYKPYNFDEVEALYKDGKTTDNLFINNKGEFKLNKFDLSSFVIFQVYNGIAFNVKENHQNILSYAIKKGIVHTEPQPVEMFSGVKNLEILTDDLFKFTYTIQFEKLGYSSLEDLYEHYDNVNTLKELIIGTFKKSISENKLNIISYDYDSDNLQLSIITSKEFLSDKYDNLHHVLNNLDLQIYYFTQRNVEWYFHLKALMQCARDRFDFYTINEEEYPIKKDKSHFEWYNKDIEV